MGCPSLGREERRTGKRGQTEVISHLYLSCEIKDNDKTETHAKNGGRVNKLRKHCSLNQGMNPGLHLSAHFGRVI